MITIDEKFEINLLSPVDLIITKLARFAQNDEEDIRNIIKTGKVSKTKLYEFATDAINVSVSFNERHVKINLDIVMEIFLDEYNLDQKPKQKINKKRVSTPIKRRKM